jgi:hypothetical protein
MSDKTITVDEASDRLTEIVVGVLNECIEDLAWWYETEGYLLSKEEVADRIREHGWEVKNDETKS